MKVKCPKCKTSDAVVSIMYGMPGPEMQNEYNEGKIKLGGCMTYENSPHYHCNECKYEWERGKPNDGHYADSDEE